MTLKGPVSRVGFRPQQQGEGLLAGLQLGPFSSQGEPSAQGDPSPAHPTSPILEGVVHDGLEHQAVPNLGWAPEVEHLNGLQCRMGTTQAAGGGQGWGGQEKCP